MLSFEYSQNIDLSNIRGFEPFRPWIISDIVKQLVKPNSTLLDIGCATCAKLLTYSDCFKQVIGLEANEALIKPAQQRLMKNHITNVEVMRGFAQELPFSDGSFDFATCTLAPFSMQELYRILKKSGIAVIERTGSKDKLALKTAFGNDEHGPRGHALGKSWKNDEEIEQELNSLFSVVDMANASWTTFYTREQLISLLEETPTIRNFELSKDKIILNDFILANETSHGVKVTQNRTLFVLFK